MARLQTAMRAHDAQAQHSSRLAQSGPSGGPLVAVRVLCAAPQMCWGIAFAMCTAEMPTLHTLTQPTAGNAQQPDCLVTLTPTSKCGLKHR